MTECYRKPPTHRTAWQRYRLALITSKGTPPLTTSRLTKAQRMLANVPNKLFF